ncbi:hypothetical protein B5S32_g251 [[Candida] boidinii]|uniref:Unnamed protein product n=1 Tax=Candida boidinii TaxID=5477 RepID=A0ACB5THM2_CANBO|nr:hypothetical protein B5S32_g251 [[Candida] boidinii]GME88539.1 unnamed protein product [[Candida] boidinii]
MTATTETRKPSKKVCVFCGSSFGVNPEHSNAATDLGKLLASKDWGLVYGGGTTGLMGLVANACASNDGYVHGIIPDALVSKERSTGMTKSDSEQVNDELMKNGIEAHKGSTPITDDGSYGKTTVVPDMHTRKRLMSEEADAFVALPGGYGTLEEIMEITTWSQLGIHGKPVIIFNSNGFYDDFIKFINNAILNGFISKKNGDIISIANSAEEVIQKIENYVLPEGRFNLSWQSECEDKKHNA